MNTAKQLISSFVDATPLYWDRSYVQNMREIRGYPNWWRIRDDVAYIDGPPNEGEQYTRDPYVWSVEIVKDEDTDENTNKLELYDLDNTLEQRTEVVNGETVYYWKYREQEPELTYEHTDVIDSVSLEFDQLGRRLIAFESAGDVFLVWYDPVPGTLVTTNWGAGYNPQIVTDTYRRTGGSADSERLLFYVDNNTKQIVYRRQDDRYQTVYTLPSAPADVVELLKVSKNLYGGLTALYVYEDGTGQLTTGSFTARSDVAQVHIGSDGNQTSPAEIKPKSAEVINFTLKAGLKSVDVIDTTELLPTSATITNFSLRDNTVSLNEQTSSANIVPAAATVTNFELKSTIRPLQDQVSSASFLADTASINAFLLKDTLIYVEPYETESAELTPTSATITNFSLG